MFYNKYFTSNYDELITYYPRYYRDVFEMKAILRTHGKLVDSLEDNIEGVFFNCFIDTADEVTIGRWEQFLDITQTGKYTLEERRQLVKSFLLGSGKFSATVIKSIIKAFTDGETSVEFANSLVSIFVDVTENPVNYGAILLIIKKKIPAHLAFCFNFTASTSINIGIESVSVAKWPLMAGEELTGIYPMISMEAKISNNSVVMNTSAEGHKRDTYLTGTMPDTNMIALLNGTEIQEQISSASVKIPYVMSGLETVGTQPVETKIGTTNEGGIGTEIAGKGIQILYPLCGEE